MGPAFGYLGDPVTMWASYEEFGGLVQGPYATPSGLTKSRRSQSLLKLDALGATFAHKSRPVVAMARPLYGRALGFTRLNLSKHSRAQPLHGYFPTCSALLAVPDLTLPPTTAITNWIGTSLVSLSTPYSPVTLTPVVTLAIIQYPCSRFQHRGVAATSQGFWNPSCLRPLNENLQSLVHGPSPARSLPGSGSLAAPLALSCSYSMIGTLTRS